MQTFHACPKRADYIYNQELVTKKKESKGYFNKGNYFHELAHGYYHLIEEGWKPGSVEIELAVLNKIQGDLRDLLKFLDKANSKEEVSLISVFGIISKRMIRYIREQSARIDRDITVKGVEREIIYPFSEGVALRGFADLVYRDRAGTLRIRDHKTGQKAWTKLDAQCSEQLLIYATIIWKISGELPVGEISYINTKEYVKKEPTFEETFAFASVSYTEKELSIFFDVICKEIDEMLQSSPTPHYSTGCQWCPFKEPCFAERKGVDSAPILKALYNVESRAGKKHARFTEAYAENDDFD